MKEPLSESALVAVIAACERMPVSQAQRLLIRAVVYAFAHAGLTMEEVMTLREHALDYEYGTLIAGEGIDSREIRPGQECMDALQAFYRSRPQKKSCDRFFVSLRINNLTPLLALLSETAGLPFPLSSSLLRVTCVARLMRQGKSLEQIRFQMGSAPRGLIQNRPIPPKPAEKPLIPKGKPVPFRFYPKWVREHHAG